MLSSDDFQGSRACCDEDEADSQSCESLSTKLPTLATDDGDIERGVILPNIVQRIEEDVTEEFVGDDTSSVYVPVAGQESLSIPLALDSTSECASSTIRSVPNGCSICLSIFRPNDRITWVSTGTCASWFVALISSRAFLTQYHVRKPHSS
jgi:hypothetical protein